MTATTIERPSLAVAAEVRAVLGRQGLTQTELARRIGHNTVWLSMRIGSTARVDMTMEEIVEMADALGVEAEGIVMAALRACRDSNPKPSDLVFAEDPYYRCRVCGLSTFGGGLCRWCREDEQRRVNDCLTVDLSKRSGWELAA